MNDLYQKPGYELETNDGKYHIFSVLKKSKKGRFSFLVLLIYYYLIFLFKKKKEKNV